MINLKNITELPVAESAEGLNLIVNDNGAAKQIAASAVGKVKTVNGMEPDTDGNVQVGTGSLYYVLHNEVRDITSITPGTYEALKNAITNIEPVNVFVMHKTENSLEIKFIYRARIDDDGVINCDIDGSYALSIYSDDTAEYWYND